MSHGHIAISFSEADCCILPAKATVTQVRESITYQSNATMIEAADQQLSSVRSPGNSITPGNVRDVAIMFEFMNKKNDREAGFELAPTRMQ
jgi:hypothetical protein